LGQGLVDVDVVKQANLALRFVLELAALATLGYWGATADKGRLVRVGLAVAAPLVAAIAWVLALALAGIYVVNRVLMEVWDQ
jgi:hypothetical protein